MKSEDFVYLFLLIQKEFARNDSGRKLEIELILLESPEIFKGKIIQTSLDCVCL